MQNPSHNDTYSIFTDAELVRYVHTFNRERVPTAEKLAEVLDKMATALAGRLEKRLGEAER